MPHRVKLPAFPPGALLVGGAARDLLRGQMPSDYDWAAPDPAQAARWTAGTGGAAFPLDERRGHWRAIVGGVQHDFVPLPADLGSELLRRDFTVNALAMDQAGRVTDPAGGLTDLRRRSLRMISEQNLRDDPLRLLRAARLSTTLDFRLEAQTRLSVQHLAAEALAQHWPLPAAERSGAELNALLLSDRAASGVLLLKELNLLALYLPELLEGAGVVQGGFHHLDVLHHNIEALHQLLARFPDADLALRWATLLHDVGKPRTRGVNPNTGRNTYYGHAEVGAQMTAEMLTRLKQPRGLTERVSALVGAHMVHLPTTEREASRFVHRRRPLLPDLLGLMLADREASRGPHSTPQTRLAYQLGFEQILSAQQERPAPPPPLLSGRQVMALLNIPPGPVVGEVIRAVNEAAALGDIRTPAEAEAFVQAGRDSFMSNQSGPQQVDSQT
ncbi:HDIG domain-containing metalloprotein [Deinococcus rubellus]|uniref:HD domain-containing protein n=1 Tax=Deinococcus rubellus TaxID=1889240 RepID=A0ABY5YCG3_9DEIO|nr:HDIG domain-containing metalloprotein [Deinococcus rubellus]UWX62734.1 HD domain-containing protein [Deinococcus rubellus]